jgi:hypothetical protein
LAKESIFVFKKHKATRGVVTHERKEVNFGQII